MNVSLLFPQNGARTLNLAWVISVGEYAKLLAAGPQCQVPICPIANRSQLSNLMLEKIIKIDHKLA